MLYFGINHENYSSPDVSSAPFAADEFEYTDAHTTGEEYVLVGWNDEMMVVYCADNSLTTLAAKWYNDFNVDEWHVPGQNIKLDTTRDFIGWVNSSWPDKDSSSGYGVFDSKGDMIAGPDKHI